MELSPWGKGSQQNYVEVANLSWVLAELGSMAWRGGGQDHAEEESRELGTWMGHVEEKLCGREREQAVGKHAEYMVCVRPLP